MMDDEAIETVHAALNGENLDISLLETLIFDPQRTQRIRDKLVPLFIELLTSRPETASQIPLYVVDALLSGATIDELVQLTGIDAHSLDNPLLRSAVLSQMALKAKASQTNPVVVGIIEKAMQLYANPELDSSSVSQIEHLVSSVPLLAAKYLPLNSLFNGCAVLKSRFMDVSIILLENKISLDPSLVLWENFADENDDALLAALQVAYVGKLLSFFVRHPEIQQSVRNSLYKLSQQYSTDTLLSSTIEEVLIQCSNCVPSLFLELDAQFLLVNKNSTSSLLANIPAAYIVKHHISVIDALELRNETLNAIANIATDYMGLQRLRLSASKLAQIPVPSQVKIAAAATTTSNGAKLFKSQYENILRTAVDAPYTQEMASDKRKLEANLNEWGIRIINSPRVATISQ